MKDSPRTIRKSLASIVEQLELEQPKIVTLDMLGSLAQAAGKNTQNIGDVRKLAYRLESVGWLGKLRTRGAWEFLPGARAGAYGSQDHLIEFRAQLLVNPSWKGALAMESAAVLLGFAQRLPQKDTVAIPPGESLPKALSTWRRVSISWQDFWITQIEGLPTWHLEALITGIAIRPSAYHDLPGLAQWLPDAGRKIDAEKLMVCLIDSPVSVWQRAAYLSLLAGANSTADTLLSKCPPKTSIWFGATRSGGEYQSTTMINDADLAPLIRAGVTQ